MSAAFEGLAGQATDWRKQLQLNQRRTHWVMAIFIVVYLAIGFLLDLYHYSAQYPRAPLALLGMGLLTLRLFPYFTLITSAIAVLSIFVAYALYDKIMLLGTEYQEITPQSTSLAEKQLYNIVEEMKVAAGLKYMPRIFIIDADYMNAFASGYSEKSAMVAITRGLMAKLERSELQAVMAHELSHIRHLDIKLTMMAAILSNLMLILVDLLFFKVIYSRRSRENSDNRLFFVIMLLRYTLPLITMLLLLYLSRTREYMADAGCVALMRDNLPLGRALLKIHQDYQQNAPQYRQAYQATPHENVRREAYLYDPLSGLQLTNTFSGWFSTHPTLAQRLAALGLSLPKS